MSSALGARLGRRLSTLFAVLVAGLAVGCGGNVSGSQNLIAQTSRARGVVDGFVFVPSRQTGPGELIPHAVMKVFLLPVDEGEDPFRTAQADSAGRYRVDDLPTDAPLLIIGEDPLQVTGEPFHRLCHVVSFSAGNLEKTRNMDDATTLASEAVAEQRVSTPISDDQVNRLVAASQQLFATDPNLAKADITNVANGDVFVSFAVQLRALVFGSLSVRVQGPSGVEATVLVNGGEAGRAVTGSQLVVGNLLLGQVQVQAKADGFQTASATVTIQPNATASVVLTLVPTGQTVDPVDHPGPDTF